ncbi:MAG: hypothetical protein ACRC28_13580 [Clostridium sp.]|uniref:hypothetical protein n=1 Tax=Clostridium sp. TaxID=1506 RepID=UPI003F3329AC
MSTIEQSLNSFSNMIWAVFIPILIIIALYVSIKIIFKVQKQITSGGTLSLKKVVGPAAISLGNMLGTGAIIGVLGSLSQTAAEGQHFIEALCFWALVGALFLIPLTYCETLISKATKLSPKDYISKFITPKAGLVYSVCFVVLFVFGFGGFQFSGINAAFAISANKSFHIALSSSQMFWFIAFPIILILSLIVLSKKNNVFLSALTLIISVAVVLYLVFFICFLFKTRSYLPVFFGDMGKAIENPVAMYIGIPVGIVLGMQRTIQTASLGLGALAIAAEEADNAPIPAALISSISGLIAVFIAIFATSYITSYGVSHSIITLPSGSFERLIGFYNTGISVTGIFGLVSIAAFSILSGIASLLGPYFYLQKLLNIKENYKIALYIVLISIAGILAVVGFSIVFALVNFLLFLVCGINIIALTIFAIKGFKEYRLSS